MISPDRHRIARDLFDAACDLPASDRDAFLNDRCGADELLRKEVESLLRHAAETNAVVDAGQGANLIAEGLAPGTPQVTKTDEHALPKRIGPYRIVRRIGRGGMGAVYEAEQDQPRRRVALKVIRAEFATEQSRRRFHLEAEVLGRLQHPGIAHIYEAGIAESSTGPQPYFAMELIDGEPLDKFVRNHQLEHRQILSLMTRLCDAIHYAHQKGVIHRDLKPDNIQVVDQRSSAESSPTDTRIVAGTGQPKVLDFGVARLTEADIQSATLQTQTGQIVGTLGYMSPEQLSGDPALLDTRCDVYALGVILYRLLAQRMPHDITGVPIAEAVRQIRDEEPPRLGSLDGELSGDIETIVTKAMEKDVERRYDSAAALGDDIRRLLASEPIAAHPPSTFYRFRKFTRRNRTLVAGALGTFLALAGGLVGMSILFFEAAEQRDLAEENLRAAEIESQKSQRVAELMTDMIAGVGPSVALGRDTTMLREIVDQTALQLSDTLVEQPDVEATMRETIGKTYSALAEFDRAELHLLKALQIRKEVGDAVALGNANALVAELRWKQGNAETAEEIYRESLEELQSALPADDPHVLYSTRKLAFMLGENAKYQQSEELFRPCIDTLRKQGRTTELLGALHDFAIMLDKSGNLKEAETCLRESLDLADASLPPNHPSHVNVRISLGQNLNEQGAYEEAALVLSEALRIAEEVLGPDHQITLSALNNLGMAQFTLGKRDDCIALNRDLLARRRRSLGATHIETVNSMNNLAFLLLDKGDVAGAEPLYREAVDARITIHGESHPRVAHAIGELGWLLDRKGEFAEAATMFQKSLDISLQHYGEKHYLVSSMRLAIGNMWRKLERLDEAEPLLRRAVSGFKNTLGDKHWRTAEAQTMLAACLLELDVPKDEARKLLQIARTTLQDVRGGSDGLRPLVEELLEKAGE